MGNKNLRKLVNQGTEGVDELFYNDRLDRTDVAVSDYPARIDQAAVDLLYGVSIGKSKQSTNPLAGSGMVDTFDFGRATGSYYQQGLVALAGESSDLPQLIDAYEPEDIGDLTFRLNQLRYRLGRLREKTDQAQVTDMTRVLEAVIEKAITRSIHASSSDTVQNSIEDPETVAELMTQIFSDPASSSYADQLLQVINDTKAESEILKILDSPEMVTPLWIHQREAIIEWVENGCTGYVDMATATGKTVLGLAAISTLFGRLHPSDEAEVDRSSLPESTGKQRVLIVAGQDLLLEQWRSEFDEHLNIPRDRTGGGERNRTITLDWGVIEFKTAQELLAADGVGSYDLVVLDEAHQYTRGSRSGKGWAAVFEELVEYSSAVLAMSGSVDQGWLGDEAVETALTSALPLCKRFTVAEARAAGVIADFAWTTVYAGAAASDGQRKLAATTTTLREAYDEKTHKFDPRLVDDSLGDGVAGPFETLSDLRAFGQSKAGSDLRERSDQFDRLATAAFSRRPQRWHLSPTAETVATLVAEHAPTHKTVVLVQSYKQAAEIKQALGELIGEGFVLVPDADADDQYGTIEQFNDGEYQVIVGPGEVLGTGVDMPDADVAINVSKGGVNASLIQRMGRVLRNPTGEKQARFYQVVTVPSEEGALILGEDGRRLVRRAAEFRALGARLRELPGFVTADDATASTVHALERAGVAAVEADHRGVDGIVSDEVARKHLQELVDRVAEREDTGEAVIVSEWRNETLGRDLEPVKDAVAIRTGSTGDDETTEREDELPDTAETDRPAEPDTEVDDRPPASGPETAEPGDEGDEENEPDGSNSAEEDGAGEERAASNSLFGRALSKLRSLL